MPYSQNENDILELTSIICSSFSICGGLFIITTYFMFEKMKRMAYQLVVFVAISDLIRSIGNVFGNPENGFWCSLQGLLKNFGGLSSFLWIFTIAFVMYSILFYASLWNNPNLKQRLIIMSSVIYTLSFILSILPLILDEYKELEAWCWISNVNEGKALRWISFYGWLLFVFFGTCILYSIMLWKIRGLGIKKSMQNNDENDNENSENNNNNNKKDNQKSKRDKMFDRIKYYPFVLLICYLFGVIRRVIQAFDESAQMPFAIAFLHVFLSSLYGLCNSVIYGLTPRVKKEWKKQLSTWKESIFGVDIMKNSDNDGKTDNGRASEKAVSRTGTGTENSTY